jgi:hypothetical protein
LDTSEDLTEFMDRPTRRSFLFGGAAFVTGTAIGSAATAVTRTGADDAAERSASQGTSAKHGDYIWAVNPDGVLVPSDTWTKIPWPKTLLNTMNVHLDREKAIWTFPVPSMSGIFAILCNVAWDNAYSPTGEPIRPPTHRKFARIPQQDVGRPQNEQPVNLGASTELLYHADLAARRGQDVLADGSKAFQQQQVYIQTGVASDGKDQRTWVEVYQDSGQPLMCRWDGSSVQKTATFPPIVGLQAPSLMVAKLCDF